MILIVDDKPENLYSLKSLLESKKFNVDTALSGEEALKKVLQKNYALIILDVQMPGMDGFEVAEALSGYSKTKDIPIIFLSAINTDKKFVTKGYESGGIDYVTKPVDPDILTLKAKTFYRLYEQTVALNEIQRQLKVEINIRKQAQEELNAKVEHLHTILESLPQIAFTADYEGRITFVNERWFRYSDSALEFPREHPEDKKAISAWLDAIGTAKPIESEVRIRDISDGRYRFHLLRILPIKENDGPVTWVGTFTDIDDQKQIERKKDEFLSIASHELKTPLTSVKAYVQLLGRILATGADDKVTIYIHRTQEQVMKLESLIADLLDISKAEAGKLEMAKKEVCLEDIIRNVIDTITHTHQHDRLKIERQGPPFTTRIFADSIRIEQVLINFLTNAIKYSPGEDKILIRTDVRNGNAFVAVQDFGIGIPKEKQQHVFSKFYRVEESSLKFQGLGIGLYICAEILRQHQGDYGLESKVGEGTTFYFTIPFKPGKDA